MTQSSASVPVSRFSEPESTILPIVIDAYGNPWGPFESVGAAYEWAMKKWGEDAGWDACVLRPPDEIATAKSATG